MKKKEKSSYKLQVCLKCFIRDCFHFFLFLIFGGCLFVVLVQC